MSRSNALSRSNEPPPASPGLARGAHHGPRRLGATLAGNPESGRMSPYSALAGGGQRVADPLWLAGLPAIPYLVSLTVYQAGRLST